MNIEYTPQRSDNILSYEADGDVLTVTCTQRGQQHQDTFDFSGVPDGELDREQIETTLPVQPILSAKKENGELTVRVLRWYGKDEKHLFEGRR